MKLLCRPPRFCRTTASPPPACTVTSRQWRCDRSVPSSSPWLVIIMAPRRSASRSVVDASHRGRMPRHMRRRSHRPPSSPVSLTKVARLGVCVLHDWGQTERRCGTGRAAHRFGGEAVDVDAVVSAGSVASWGGAQLSSNLHRAIADLERGRTRRLNQCSDRCARRTSSLEVARASDL